MTPPKDVQAKIAEQLTDLLAERGLTPQAVQNALDDYRHRGMLSRRAKHLHQFRSQSGGRS